MPDITISYNGNTIATMSESGTKTLLTDGKYCEDDITVVYVSPGGGSATLITKSITENGTYNASSDNADGYSSVTVNVSGGGSSNDVADMFPIPSGYTLPSNYQKLAYCDSVGAQVCDTGYTPTIDTTIELAGYFIPGTYSGYAYLVGSINPTTYISTQSVTGARWWGFGNKSDFWQQSVATGKEFGIPLHTLNATEGKIEAEPFSAQTKTCGATSIGTGSGHITVFGRVNNGTPDRFSSARFFRLRIWEGNTLVRCVFPVLKDGTEVCLYDVVNGIYMQNLGTGNLVGGP